MAFVQIVEFSTAYPEKVKALGEQWRAETEGTRTVRRSLACLDRDDAKRFAIIAEFDSYESAMENSNLEETELLAEEMAKLFDGPPTFKNYDVMQEY